MSDDNVIFPEHELRAYASADHVPQRRAVLLAAIESHEQLRERCLTAEMRLGQAQRLLRGMDGAA